MNDKELCKKCIYYDDFCCRNNKAICVNNSEYREAETVINAIINQEENETQPVKQEIIELLNECRETIFGATYTSGEEYTHAITLCDKISAVIGEGKQCQ